MNVLQLIKIINWVEIINGSNKQPVTQHTTASEVDCFLQTWVFESSLLHSESKCNSSKSTCRKNNSSF